MRSKDRSSRTLRLSVPHDLVPWDAKQAYPFAVGLRDFYSAYRRGLISPSCQFPVATGLALRLNWLQSPLSSRRSMRVRLGFLLTNSKPTPNKIEQSFQRVWVPQSIAHVRFFTLSCRGFHQCSHRLIRSCLRREYQHSYQADSVLRFNYAMAAYVSTFTSTSCR